MNKIILLLLFFISNCFAEGSYTHIVQNAGLLLVEALKTTVPIYNPYQAIDADYLPNPLPDISMYPTTAPLPVFNNK